MLVSLLQFLDRALRLLNVAALGVAAAFIGFLAVVGAADVIGTAFFGTPVPSALELSEAGLVVIVFMALSFAQQRRAHITVDIFSAKFTGIARFLSVALALLAAMAFFGFLAVRGGVAAWESVVIDERSEGLARIPLYPGKFALATGCLLAALESLRQFVHLLLGRVETEPADKESVV